MLNEIVRLEISKLNKFQKKVLKTFKTNDEVLEFIYPKLDQKTKMDIVNYYRKGSKSLGVNDCLAKLLLNDSSSKYIKSEAISLISYNGSIEEQEEFFRTFIGTKNEACLIHKKDIQNFPNLFKELVYSEKEYIREDIVDIVKVLPVWVQELYSKDNSDIVLEALSIRKDLNYTSFKNLILTKNKKYIWKNLKSNNYSQFNDELSEERNDIINEYLLSQSSLSESVKKNMYRYGDYQTKQTLIDEWDYEVEE